MKIYKILGYKLKHKDADTLSKGLEKYSDLTLEMVPKLEDISVRSDVAACFVYVDESVKLEELEQFIKNNQNKSLNIILKNKNFDYLMLCYRYHVTSVFEQELSGTYLTRTLVQIELQLNKERDNFPVQAVIDLFASPVKIKSDHEMYDRLGQYFSKFDKVKFFDVLKIENNELTLVSGADLDGSSVNFPLPELPDSYIGFEHKISIGEVEYVVSPLMLDEGKSSWLMLEIGDEHKDFILNNLFYKFLENVHIYRKNKEKEQTLEALATTDDVTGLYNQRKLSQDIAEAVSYHEKESKNFSIMFIDVDHFKVVNDNYGHVVGSKLLQDIGEVLSQLLRASDDIYRYGGDEFVVIMPSVNIQTVHEIATRILSKIKSKKFDIGDGTDFNLSVSIGIAEYPTDATSAIEIIRFADEMMYQSKKSGRGKVFHIKEVQHVNAGAK